MNKKEKNTLLAEHLFNLLQKATACTESEECKQFKDQGLKVAEGRLICLMLEKSLFTMNELAHLRGVSMGRMTKIIDSLVKKKIVSKKTSPQDRRIFHISLTPSGKEKANSLKKAIIDDYIHLLECYPEESKDTLFLVFEELIRAMEKCKDEGSA